MRSAVNRTIGVAVLAGVAFFATATAASASVTINDQGKGFIGKGDVQTALGYNNAALQKAVDAGTLVFTAKVPTSQALSQGVAQSGTQAGSQVGTQSGTQSASQSATQTVSQDLTCTFTNGNGTKVFHRDGERDGSRDGSRTGSRMGTRDGSRTADRTGVRTGTQFGTQTGVVTTSLDVDARKSNQYTGFIVNNWLGTPVYSATGAPVWNEPPAYGDWAFGGWSFGEYQFAGDFAFGDYSFGDYGFEPVSGTEWGPWDAAPGENPDDCLRSQNADHITQISNVITPGTITDGTVIDGPVIAGATADGAITEGAITEGAYSLVGDVTSGLPIASGSAKAFVNGKAL